MYVIIISFQETDRQAFLLSAQKVIHKQFYWKLPCFLGSPYWSQILNMLRRLIVYFRCASRTFCSSLLSLVPLGRIDRKIEFPLPDEKTKRRIFQIHTSRMTVAGDVSLDDLILTKEDLSGADIKVCMLSVFLNIMWLFIFFIFYYASGHRRI